MAVYLRRIPGMNQGIRTILADECGPLKVKEIIDRLIAAGVDMASVPPKCVYKRVGNMLVKAKDIEHRGRNYGYALIWGD